jgi:hypothetical protein
VVGGSNPLTPISFYSYLFTSEKLHFPVPYKIEDFVESSELGNCIILKHRLLLVSGGEGGRLRSDRASTAKGFVFVKKPYPTRF